VRLRRGVRHFVRSQLLRMPSLSVTQTWAAKISGRHPKSFGTDRFVEIKMAVSEESATKTVQVLANPTQLLFQVAGERSND
jgi:hypothetical protein